MPELSVSILAGLKGQPDIAVANVVGSNLFNIGFILGLCALIRPQAISGNTIRLAYPVLALVTLMCLALAQDGSINGLDGALLLSVYVGFTVYMLTLVRAQVDAAEKDTFRAEVKDIAGDLPLPAVLLSAISAACEVSGRSAGGIRSSIGTVARGARYHPAAKDRRHTGRLSAPSTRGHGALRGSAG